MKSKVTGAKVDAVATVARKENEYRILWLCTCAVCPFLDYVNIHRRRTFHDIGVGSSGSVGSVGRNVPV